MGDIGDRSWADWRHMGYWIKSTTRDWGNWVVGVAKFGVDRAVG